ncbi:hypothetical protein H2203_006166 [Taxawa tesnikishii (nom. ined.)]|nr:hypothetical protein H2203_006166 [Dothideales sp. JES 119]
MTDITSSQAPLSAEKVFDEVGPAYEKAFEGCSPQAESIRWIISQLEGRSIKPARCLDIGCGTGRPVCSSLAEAGHNVLGIDISSAMLDAARKNVPRARFEKADIRDFEPDAPFDVITVYFSMIAGVTQDEIKQFIQKIHGWLKQDGIFVFATVPVPGNNVEIRWMGKSVAVSSLEADEAVAWIRKVGFEIERHSTSTFMPSAVEAGICSAEDVWEEPHLFVYARKR